MTESLSAFFRGANSLSLALLCGGALFLLLGGPHADAEIAAWRAKWRRLFPWILAFGLGTTAAVLLLQAAETVERSVIQLLSAPKALELFLLDTRYGRVGVLKFGLAMLMLLPCFGLARTHCRESRCLWALLSLATLTILVGPLSGHTTGDERTRWLTPIHMLHILAVSAWLGGLPLWIGLAWRMGRKPDTLRCAYTAATMKRFSRLAICCMPAIVGSGLLLTASFVDTMGDLLGTRYGLLVCAKILVLVGVLTVANHARLRFLPLLTKADQAAGLYPVAGRWVAVELLLSVVILGLAGYLSRATPAIHDQPLWRLPFRVSVDATWPVASDAIVTVAVIAALLMTTLAFMFRGSRFSREAKLLGATVCVVAAGIALWQLSVPAFPATYRRSISPYLTVSIVQGKRTFEQHCTNCHGVGGLGDGPLSMLLPTPPANLSEPHTALHTAGDMFWWLTEGIPESGMPGFRTEIDEQGRWDVINFLRAFSQGFEARLLMPSIQTERPWLGAPNFYFESADGTQQELKDFRENKNVLLVFPATADRTLMSGRLHALTDARNRSRLETLEIVLISASPTHETGNGLLQVKNDAEEVRETYDLFSRTVSNRGNGKSLGMGRDHMEFLIDRFGYIRARWIPEDQPEGWNDIERLREEIVRLNREPRILPPPDDHVH